MTQVQSVLAENIPPEIREYRQWVCWKLEERPNGDISKPPYSPNRKKAKSTDPTTWSTFTEVLKAYKQEDFDGIGFVLSDKDNFCGIDLDACRDPETNQLDPGVERIVLDIESYTEVTPSGRGLRILVKAILPPSGRKRGHIEMYDGQRYLTITGQRLPLTSRKIEYRQPQIQALHQRIFPQLYRKQTQHHVVKSPLRLTDEQLVIKAQRAKNGARFSRLWAGDWTGYNSQSEADLALCSFLAFWTGKDVKRIDQLFRQSGLFREKWDKQHAVDGKTYGEATISKSLL